MELKNEDTVFRQADIKILAVDDREDNLFSIETILEKDGYTLVKANSGRAALKILLHQHDFTLILMDVQMPGMSGLETATLISEREKLKHIPIIFITAFNYEEENAFQGYQKGGVDYIYKPINPELLRVKVSVFVELYRRNHELLIQEKNLLLANEKLEKEIEERKSTEEKIRLLNLQLIDFNATLQTTNLELDRFAYVASHDLQEPLRKIQIFTDKLIIQMSDRLDDEVKLYLQKIAKASKRMQKLVNDLLTLSRNPDNKINFEQTDLNEILADVLSDLEEDVKKKKAKITAEKMPVINAIPGQIRQLFQNLVSNSIKFSRPGITPEVVIHSKLVKGADLPQVDKQMFNDAFCQIYIKDNGIGFDIKYIEDIFVIFKRLHTYDEFEGTGIGLSICKKIADKHKGFITAESQLNQGATFIITLPLQANQA